MAIKLEWSEEALEDIERLHGKERADQLRKKVTSTKET